jgi:hypothetical protein
MAAAAPTPSFRAARPRRCPALSPRAMGMTRPQIVQRGLPFRLRRRRCGRSYRLLGTGRSFLRMRLRGIAEMSAISRWREPQSAESAQPLHKSDGPLAQVRWCARAKKRWSPGSPPAARAPRAATPPPRRPSSPMKSRRGDRIVKSFRIVISWRFTRARCRGGINQQASAGDEGKPAEGASLLS